MKKILILPNPFKPSALDLTRRLVSLVKQYGFEPILEAETAQAVECNTAAADESQLWDQIDLVMVLGGDGSMLNAACRIYPRQIPLLGVNLGYLGFLTQVENNGLELALEDLRLGNYYFEERAMLEGEVIRDSTHLSLTTALNDLVVAKNSLARMIRLETWIDDEYLTTYPADGLIISTATGSTAYSLSAGGPILDPRLRAILITPICAHSLYARPVVLSKDARIRIVIDANHNDLMLTADGQRGIPLCAGDAVQVCRAEFHTKLLRFNNQGLFEVLKSRLKEGRI